MLIRVSLLAGCAQIVPRICQGAIRDACVIDATGRLLSD